VALHLNLDTEHLRYTIAPHEWSHLTPQVNRAVKQLFDKTCPGNEFLGWVDLPSRALEQDVSLINDCAREIREHAGTFILVGIGGSYLGARAVIDALSPLFTSTPRIPDIRYMGHHLHPDSSRHLLDTLDPTSTYINVISKSGTTTEPGIAFRLLRKHLEDALGPEQARKQIIATTDKQSGALRTLTDQEGYRSFVIPDDVGGRFSVLTPVGLLPIAAAGFDIEALLTGARDMQEFCRQHPSLEDNPALQYAAARTALYQKGYTTEILAGFDPTLHTVSEWWKQLFGESEGKDGKGIFPASVDFTTDLHSMGQYIQQGRRTLFETFLWVERSQQSLPIPDTKENLDGMNYLSGKDLHHVNEQAYRGTTLAHLDGGVPNMTLCLSEKNEYALGQLFYFFEFAVAVSGLMMGVNPFNQPGVEAYKRNMFALLGKPSFEDLQKQLQTRLESSNAKSKGEPRG
jgi:glucose-6-phosphate isomerase